MLDYSFACCFSNDFNSISCFSFRTPKFKGGYQRQGQAVTSAAAKAQNKGIDLDAVGTINNVPVYEFDLDSLSERDRPWRKPGKSSQNICLYK